MTAIPKGDEPMYTSGVWIVKKGREHEFARRWQESADGTALSYPDVKFTLFRDRENPQRFISLGEGWRNSEQIEYAAPPLYVSRRLPDHRQAAGFYESAMSSKSCSTPPVTRFTRIVA